MTQGMESKMSQTSNIKDLVIIILKRAWLYVAAKLVCHDKAGNVTSTFELELTWLSDRTTPYSLGCRQCSYVQLNRNIKGERAKSAQLFDLHFP